ncbi:MAG: ABC transporter ATP-binding protein [Gemmataceae bacterium]
MERIYLEDIHLTFLPGNRGARSLKDFVLARLRKQAVPCQRQVLALRGVSFSVHDGERLGIVGHNGAGKSSLLRLLAGVYQPTAGVRRVAGRISSLFELHLGFEQEATGWENIRYRGYLQKESPASIEEKMQEIAEFSELGPALDLPIRYYSSGMLVRLAFSIATSVNPEILLLDEVLAAGDLAFVEKSRQRIRQLMARARAIVLVSHDLKTLRTMCDRVLWLDHGQIRQIGPTDATIDAYEAYMKARVPGRTAA